MLTRTNLNLFKVIKYFILTNEVLKEGHKEFNVYVGNTTKNAFIIKK